MKVALVKPPATYANWYRRPVLGLSYLGALLESHGHECEIFDAYFRGWSDADLIERIRRYRPDVVGISAMTHEITRAAALAAGIKAARPVPVIIGGCHVTALGEAVLEEFPAFDFGVCGEGENTLLELLGALERPAGIRGVIYREGGKIIRNDPRPALSAAELDALPRPAFHHYYGDNPKALAGKDDYYVMFTARGCPYHCIFCMQVLGNTIRRRSPENILEEMEFAMRAYGAHTFDFADEIFLIDTPDTRRTLELIIERGWPQRIRWSGLTRANLVNPELIALARRAGCFRLEMGVESGDPEMLKTIGKKITLEQIERAVRIIKDSGIATGTYYILGHPGETEATIRRTIDLAVRLNTDTIAIGIMVPYPGTKVYEMAQRGEGGYRLLSRNWADYDKYGGRALEIEGLPYAVLEKWQQRGLLMFYLKNMRLRDGAGYFWARRKSIAYLLLKKLGLRQN